MTEATLDELAQRLVELRQHIEHVRIGLSRATFSAEESSLRCHTCARARSADEAGWTLRLCGDDELHPFCPDCDRLHVNGHNGNGQTPVELGGDRAGD